MSVEAILAGRAAAEALMLDECVITAPGGAGVRDPETGLVTQVAGAVVYSGPCKVQTRDVVVNKADAGEREIGVVREELHLPVDGSAAVKRGCVATITAVHLLSSVTVGQQFTVTGPHPGTLKTARRLPVEAVV